MAQNIYDDPTFFANYLRLRRSVDGLAGAPEWPALRSLLPAMHGRRVVDLGCGLGWFCRWAADAGAASVVGIDLSERMLERARVATSNAVVEYRRADLDVVDLGSDQVDLVYSSLTLHYLPELDSIFTRVRRCLGPDGRFVFSVEHPMYTAPSRPGFIEGPDGTTVWPIDSYLDEGERRTNWLAPDVLKYHQALGSYVGTLLRCGFTLEGLVEWAPSAEQIAAEPDWANERHRPPFLLISARM